MWILIGMVLGYILVRDSGIRGGGVIVTNSKDEILFLQNATSGQWGFPKRAYEPEDIAYYFTAIRVLKEETTFQAHTYEIQPGGCRYGDTMYFYGTLTEVPALKLDLQNEYRRSGWFHRIALPDSFHTDTLDWISEGMPSSCYLREEL
jgi:8-oxo-dGTP pyrophosphatase MutT (NUDIX family)